MPLASQGQRRLPASGVSTKGAFDITAGRLAALPADPSISLGSKDQLARGAKITFGGTGADNSTFAFRVWTYQRGVKSDNGLDDYDLKLFGTGTATLSAAVGAVGATVVASTERLADTLTWAVASESTTPKGFGDDMEAAYQSPGSRVFSPADDTPALLTIPDLGGAAGIIVEFDLTGATGAFALVEPMT